MIASTLYSTFQNFSSPQISYWSVVGWLVVGCRWLVRKLKGGRLVGDFKETPSLYFVLVLC